MTSDPTYTMGYSDAFLKMLERRNAASHASFILHLLKPGIDILDAGCGPGTISMGIAQAVEPGKLTGIDFEESQLDIAREAAQASKAHNVEFISADALSLPFDDESFDAVFCHTLLMHIPDTATALNEFKRVLRPGGFVASRDVMVDSCFNYPDLKMGRVIWDAYGDVLEANGGHRNMGVEARGHMVAAGFNNVNASATFEHFGNPEGSEWWFDFSMGFFKADNYRQDLVRYSIADETEIARWIAYVEENRNDPSTFSAIAWGEAIGWKPGD